MKLTIQLPSNFFNAYAEILVRMKDDVSVERTIAKEAKDHVQNILYGGWEMLDENFTYPTTEAYDPERVWKTSRRIIKKHHVPKPK